MNPVYLSICAIIRNEAPYIGEWLEFHRLAGVDRFYLEDDGSTDDTLEVIRRHDDRGDIVIRPWEPDESCCCPQPVPFRASHQVVCFNRFIRDHGDTTQWVAFIDPDEYLYHRDLSDVVDLRDRLFEEIEATKAPALFVNWLVFGSNGHATKPPGLTIEAYTRRGFIGEPEPTGRHGKLIARPESLEYFGPFGSHNAIFKGAGAVNENGTPVIHATNPDPSTQRWRLNHYYHRSAQEARARVNALDNNAVKGFYKTKARMRKHDLNDIEDRDILRFLPRLTEAMG